jgi:uncharacterized protein (TIGR02598 family)
MDFFLIDLKISILECYRSKFAAASKSKSHPMPDSPPDSDTAGRKRPQSKSQAFSLVEVVIAMGIFSFAIVATFSLIGQSFKSYSSAINDTVSRQIMNQLAANAQQARLSDLTTTPSYTLNFDRQRRQSRSQQRHHVCLYSECVIYTGNNSLRQHESLRCKH